MIGIAVDYCTKRDTREAGSGNTVGLIEVLDDTYATKIDNGPVGTRDQERRRDGEEKERRAREKPHEWTTELSARSGRKRHKLVQHKIRRPLAHHYMGLSN